MGSTTITVRTETRDRLVSAKLEGKFRSLDALIEELLVEYRRKKLQETSALMRRKMREKGLTLRDLIR